MESYVVRQQWTRKSIFQRVCIRWLGCKGVRNSTSAAKSSGFCWRRTMDNIDQVLQLIMLLLLIYRHRSWVFFRPWWSFSQVWRQFEHGAMTLWVARNNDWVFGVKSQMGQFCSFLLDNYLLAQWRVLVDVELVDDHFALGGGGNEWSRAHLGPGNVADWGLLPMVYYFWSYQKRQIKLNPACTILDIKNPIPASQS